jgi:hypothetical protein
MIFEIFECGWPRLGLEDQKNDQKTQKKIRVLEIFSIVEVQKFNVFISLTRLINPDKKKTLDILWWEV